MQQTKVQGIVAIYINENGKVVADAADFNRSCPGGYTLREAQEFRAKQNLSFAVIRAYCSDTVVNSLESYECESIVRKLPGKISIIPIGYEEGEK